MADPSIGAIVLDVDSPGGTVAGTVETAAAVRAAAAVKPVVAVANTLAASAAYWIASQARELVVVPSGDVGSIGVMTAHVDASRLYERLGIAVTVVKSDRYKGEGLDFGPLDDDARAHLQSRVDAMHAAFVSAVAEGRRVPEKRVRESFGQGRVVAAAAAVERGMADRVATIDDVVAGLATGRGRAFQPRRSLAFA